MTLDEIRAIQPGDMDVDLAAYLEAAEKASAPPWTASRDTFDRAAIKSPQHHEPLCFIYEGWEQRDSNFITLSRTAGPAAARRALAAEAVVEALKAKRRFDNEVFGCGQCIISEIRGRGPYCDSHEHGWELEKAISDALTAYDNAKEER